MMQFVQGDEKQFRVCEKDYDCKSHDMSNFCQKKVV